MRASPALRHLLPLLLLPLLFLAACRATSGGSGGVLPADSLVYFASPQGRVYALDPGSRSRGLPFPATGEWVYPQDGKGLGSLYAGPVLGGDVLYLATFQGQVIALNRESGTERGGQPLFKGDPIVATPLLSPEALLVPSGNRLYALDPASGRQRWSQPFAAQNRFWSQPVLAGEQVVVGSLDHYLYAIELASGRERWRFHTEGGIGSPPAVGDGIIFVGSFDRKLYALDKEGKPAWPVPFLAKGWIWSRPLYHQGRVYFGDLEGEFYALEARTGEERWRRSLEGAVRASPALSGESLMVATATGWVYGLARDDGKLLWRFPVSGQPPGKEVTADLIVSAATVYVAYPGGTIYALETGSGRVQWSFPVSK